MAGRVERPPQKAEPSKPAGKKKGKGGRKPWKPTADELKQIESLAGRGFFESEIMMHLGISKDTFYKNKGSNPEFTEALKKGRLNSKVFFTGKLVELASKGNTAAIIFGLKTLHGYREGAQALNPDAAPEFYDPGKKEQDDGEE